MKNLYLALRIAEFPVSLLAGVVAHKLAFAAAYAERGYRSLGGEIFAFPIVFALMVVAFEWAIEEARIRCIRSRIGSRRRRPKKRCGR